jgi:pimeloyl-ACP methyl ester carboxylesterase
MPKIKVGDINMYYEVYGDGFPLVMINGLSTNVYWWDPLFIEEISKKYRVVIFDNRGAGRTDKPEIDYSIKMFADDTIGLMDALKISKAHVLGVSMGGMIAQEIAINHPERVEKLVLCVTHPGGTKAISPSPEVISMLIGERAGRTPEEIVENTIYLLYPPKFIDENPEVVEQTKERISKYMIPPEFFLRQFRAIMEFDAFDRLKKIKSPTLVVGGGKDILVPPENSRIIAEAIPNAKLVIFDEAGHGLIAQEREKFAEMLLSFLSE